MGGRDYNHRDVDRTAVCVESQQVKDKKKYICRARATGGGELKTIFKLYYIGNIMLKIQNWVIQMQQMMVESTHSNQQTTTYTPHTHVQDEHTLINILYRE